MLRPTFAPLSDVFSSLASRDISVACLNADELYYRAHQSFRCLATSPVLSGILLAKRLLRGVFVPYISRFLLAHVPALQSPAMDRESCAGGDAAAVSMDRKVLSMALPSIAAELSTPLLGVVDSARTPCTRLHPSLFLASRCACTDPALF